MKVSRVFWGNTSCLLSVPHSLDQLGLGQDMELRDEKKARCEEGDTRSIKTCT